MLFLSSLVAHLLTHRAEVARLASEELARETKQRTGQQLRELQVDRGEAQRSLSELQAAAERQERLLTVRDRVPRPVGAYLL